MKMFKAIQIQTVTGCTRRCDWCPNKNFEGRKGEMMDMGLYAKIIKQLFDLDFKGRISPYLMNEPLLDLALEIRIAHIKDFLPNCEVLINTNGDLLSDFKLKLLFRCGLDKIYINCYDENSYNRLKCLEQKNVYVVQMYKPENRKGFYNRAGLVDMRGSIKQVYCERPFEQMYIDYLGRALLCCSDYKKQVIMGDVRKQSLKEIWNGKKYKFYRDNLKKGNREPLELCNKCNYPQ